MSANARKYGARLVEMSWEEFRLRAAQELAKRSDAIRFGGMRQFPKPRVEPSGKFFFSGAELQTNVAFLRRQMSAAVQQAIARAERICLHQFDLLGYEGITYGPDIDWHLDAISGKRAPLKPWYKIHYLDYSEVGDVKVTWELNRHQHLVTLAKAYCYTGKEEFAAEAIRQWYSWREQNPYPFGVNWASSLEVAFRSISWLWMLHLLQIGAVTGFTKFQANVYQALMLSGRHIETYLSAYFSPNTHLLGEGVALFYLGVLCESASSARWRRRGWEIVLAQAQSQVLPDGMHFEQSTYYHVYALDMLLHARILAAANGISVAPELDIILNKMLDALCILGRAGMPPRFGDDDGGRFFDPSRNRVEHLLDPLSIGDPLFSRPDFKSVKPELVEETVWLLGPEKASKCDTDSHSQQLESAALRASGIYLMIFSDKASSRLAIDAGPHGAAGGGHGHADALSVQLSISGREVLIDPGTFSYATGGSERQIFRGTAFHNTLRIDGRDQAEPDGPFPWRRLPDVRVENWTQGNSFDFLVASHDGFTRLAEPVIHRRSVFGLQSKFWLVLDTVEGQGTHHAEVFWHLAPELRWRLETNGARAVGETGGIALLFAELPGVQNSIQQGWYSSAYGRREKSDVLVFRHEDNFRGGFATLLFPLADPARELGQIGRLPQESESFGVRAFRYDGPGESHLFFFPRHRPWQWRDLEGDAGFLCYSISLSDQKRNLFACDCSYLKIAGETAISAPLVLSSVECSTENADSGFFTPNEARTLSIFWDRLVSLERCTAEGAIV